MSAGTQAAPAHHETQKFPGNCTLQMALDKIVDVYHHYSTQKSNFDFLNFDEFKTLLSEQAPTFLQACNRNRPGYLNQLFRETDLNKDKELTFEEFTTVLAKITDDAHHIFHKDDRCTPDKN